MQRLIQLHVSGSSLHVERGVQLFWASFLCVLKILRHLGYTIPLIPLIVQGGGTVFSCNLLGALWHV